MEKTVFTNGCFDILHAGHVDLLTRARSLGTRLIVGLNSDASVRRIKGAARPIVDQEARRRVLLGLKAVDDVIIFDEPTPERLIKEICPQILVKGGDWATHEIIGANFVIENGGAVYSLPLVEGYSTTKIAEQIKSETNNSIAAAPADDARGIIKKSLAAHQEVFARLLIEQIDNIEQCAALIVAAARSNNRVLLCGNGGSAADAQHIAAEFVGRFERERRALAAVALTTDSSALTAIGNDYGFERVFARQVEALARPDDVLIGISTSGNSPNVLAAMLAAREIGCRTIGLTGAAGKKLAGVSDAAVLVPSSRTAHIQEAHSFIGHVWCELVDAEMKDEG